MTGLQATWGREARAAPDRRRLPSTAPDRVVRLPLAGSAGTLLEMVAMPAMGEAGGGGYQRLASLPGPADSRGALFVLVEGVPPDVAAVFHRTVRRAFAEDHGTQSSRLLRAMRAGCRRLERQALHRFELAGFGATVLLVERGQAHFSQLSPSQAYVLDGDRLRAIPEQQISRAGHLSSATGRRWEVELEVCRLAVGAEASFLLCPSGLAAVSPRRLGELLRLPIERVPAALEALGGRGEAPKLGAREAIAGRLVPRADGPRMRLYGLYGMDAPPRARRRVAASYTGTGLPKGGAPVLDVPLRAWGLRQPYRPAVPLLRPLLGHGSGQLDVVVGPRGRSPTRRLILGGAAVALAAVAAAAGWPWTLTWPPLAPFRGAAAPVPTAEATPVPLAGRTLLTSTDGFSALAFDGRQGLTFVLDAAQQLHQLRGGDVTGGPRALAGEGPAVPPAPGQRTLLASREGDVLLLDGKRGLWQIAGGDPPRPLALRDAGRWQRPTAMVAYAGNLYVLDTGGDGLPQVWRHPGARDGGYDAPQAWLQAPSGVPLGDGTGMAIDGAIWVSRGNGQILRLAAGRPEPFAPAGLEQPITAAGTVHTERDYRSVYVLDTALRRVVQLRKDGQFERQVSDVFPAGEEARALWVDEPSGRALVLTERRLQEVLLEPAG